MLKVFRDNLKYLSWVLWLVVAVFILFVFVDFGGTIPGPAPPTEAAAVVGDDEISYGELQRAYRQTEESYRQAYGAQFTPELARQLQLPLQVLEQLVNQRILLDEAERMGLRVSDTELQKAVLQLPIFQDDSGGFVGADQYRRIVRSIGYGTPEEFEEAFRSDMLLGKLNRVLSDNIFVADEEVERAYRTEAETAKIEYVRIPAARFRDEAELTTEEVEAHFRENIEDFRLPERRAVDYLMVDSDVVRQGLTVAEADLRAYYTANAADYDTEEQVRARQILLLLDNEERGEEETRQQLEVLKARVEAGEDFAQLASEFSEDSFTAAQGGEMAPFGRGQILPEVEEAAFAAQPGDIVGPIKRANAYQLLEIIDYTPGGVPPFEAMKDVVERRVLAERAREATEAKARELAERLRREEIGSSRDLELIAEADTAVSYRTTQPFGRSDNVPGVGRSTPFSEAAFGLAENEVSEPVRVGSGWAVVRLIEIEPPRLPELAEVDADVRNALRGLRAEARALEEANELHRRLVDGATLPDVAETLDLTVETSGAFGADSPIGGTLGTNDDVAAAALALEAGDVGDPIVAGSDVILFKVVERAHFDPAAFAEAKDAKREEIASRRLDELLGSVVAERRDALEITYDPQMAENLGLAG